MPVLRKIAGFLNLYRPDVFFCFLLFYFLGCSAAAGFSFYLPYHLLVSLLVCGISFNFIYSLNSWSDADIDAINKPHRPIPSGVITRGEAFTYSMLLLLLSVLYPFFLFGLAIPTLICLLFPLAGVLYSNPVYAFKKKKYLALALIVSAIVFIFLLGFLVSGGKPDVPLYLLLVMSALYGIGLVPLKDISDVEGDSAGGAENWFSTTGSNARIFALSIVLFAAASMLGLASGSLLIGIIMLINLAYFILLASFFSFRGRPWKRFFKLFMRIQPFTVGIFWIWYAFSNGGFFN